MKDVIIRPFTFSKDGSSVFTLIQSHIKNANLKKNFVLPISKEQLKEKESYFFVSQNILNHQIVACGSYHYYRENLVEIRTLLVCPKHRGLSLGSQILSYIENYLKTSLQVSQTFVLTSTPSFFMKNGYLPIEQKTIPEKVWKDCQNCIYQNDCQETPLIKNI